MFFGKRDQALSLADMLRSGVGEWAWNFQEMWLGSEGTESGRRSVRAGLVMAHLKSACNVATSIGLDTLMCLVRCLGEDAN